MKKNKYIETLEVEDLLSSEIEELADFEVDQVSGANLAVIIVSIGPALPTML